MPEYCAEGVELVANGAANYSKLVDFEDTFRNPEELIPWKNVVHRAIKEQIAVCNVRKSVLRFVPIVKTLKSYNVKEDLPNDVVAGLTSGVMMIPQGMAFAALSTLPPIVGLYISFFSSITYFILGTGRQLSWGCIAILSLMVATILDKYDNSLLHNTPAFNNSSQVLVPVNFVSASNSSIFSAGNTTALPGKDYEANMAIRIQVASAVTLVAGFVLIIASFLGLSRITCLMSNSLITGYTVGLSFLVATSQLKIMFGIAVPRYSGPGAALRTWVSVLWNLSKTNVTTLVISIISILVLYLVKRFINDRYKKRLRIPVPIELIVVIIATLISKFAFLHDNYSIKVVEDIPVGFPAPFVPDLNLAKDYIADGLVIIVIAYAQTLAMAKTLGFKNSYVIDPNQEMFACGVCSVVCGLFSGFICGSSVSRSLVQEGAGGKTQVSSLFAAGLVLLVIMVIGPYFYYLPMCVLGAITVVNLQSMFLKLFDIPGEWRKSHYDCAVWVFSCIASFIFNADVGLLASILFSLSMIVLRMLTTIIEAGQIQSSSLTVELRSLEKYSMAKQLHSIKIIKIVTPLYFINSDIFTADVFSKTGIDPIRIKKQRKIKTVPQKNNEAKSDKGGPDGNDTQDQMLDTTSLSKFVVLDASGVSFIDLMGVQALQFLINEFTSVDVEVLIASLPESIIPMLKSTGFLSKNGDRLFLSIEAALASVLIVNKSMEMETLSSTNNTFL